MEQLIFSSVVNDFVAMPSSIEILPNARASVAFTDPKPVFKEDGEITPTTLSDTHAYMPWGATNQMPFDIMDLIESDETLATCQMFNAEVCYGSGLVYDTAQASAPVADAVEDFTLDNDLPSYFLGVCQDLKHFAFAVSVIILNSEATKIVRIIRKEACYCRFAPADTNGRIPRLYFANWRKFATIDDCEIIEMLDAASPFADLRDRLKRGDTCRKFAIVCRVPTPDSTYYPIPYYGALFRGKWYNIKRLIGLAKEAKLRNSAPLKYHIEVSQKYWDSIFKSEGITDRAKQQARIIEEKQRILDFLTGAENSGKVWFSTFYVNPNGDEQHDVVINKIDSDKEGGDWESDIQEAVNMICFTLRVHSNLVGTVPGKAQTNNSGSDKRELYTIAQALQKPYHDLLFAVHRIIIRFNGWKGVKPLIPFIQLTTLDENRDAKKVKVESGRSREH